MYEEVNGKESLRQRFNKEYTQDAVQLKYFEIGFDNICDLACDGCCSEWSHTWGLKEDPTATTKQVIASTDKLYNIPEGINKVVFLGGEPLMTNRHRRFLERIDTLQNLEVEYFTNGMHELHQDDYAILAQCKRVHFTVSIDGYGKLNENVRSNSKWDKVLNTLDTIADTFDYTIHTTIHKNNWHGLPMMAKFTQDYKHWTTNILTYPKKLDIMYLTKNKKNKLLKILDNYNIPNSDYIRVHINGKME
jgi:MoaA/NifB/PqqE/SkfB family radical SAM enzyme